MVIGFILRYLIERIFFNCYIGLLVTIYNFGCTYSVILRTFLYTVFSIRSTDDRKEVSNRCTFVTVCADFRSMCRQHRGPRDLGPVAREPSGYYATLSPKQLKHHIDVRTRPVSAQDYEESSLINGHEC